MEDITKTGPVALKGLNRLDNTTQADMQNINVENLPKLNLGRTPNWVGLGEDIPVLSSTGDFGLSYFDPEVATQDYIEDVTSGRAELQGALSKIANGITKGVILAGTTFADGIGGTIAGLMNWGATGEFNKFWDNPFSQAMLQINEWSEEAIPNYYSQTELDRPWYENFFTANFWGDKFLKNLGFTVGAYYSGKVFTPVAAAAVKGAAGATKAIGAGQLTKNILKASPMILSVTGALLSAVNEGKIEAINNTKDWADLQTQLISDQHAQLLADIEALYGDTEMGLLMAAQAELAYNETLAKIQEDRAKMGNADLLLNLPILLASNMIEFSNLYSGGYKTARKMTNIAKKNGKYIPTATKLGALGATVKTALSEGSEEVSQQLAADIPGKYYEQDVNNFYKAKLNPEAEQLTIDLMKTIGSTISETLGKGDTWEQFVIGGMTGALGMPVFRSARNKNGGFQSPVTIEGGALGELKLYKEDRKRGQEISDYLNQRLESPEFLNYYLGLIRHNKYQNDMDRAVDSGDEFEYKNAAHSLLISDIVMFDNAGKLNDLRDMINDAYQPTDENIQSILDNTTDENGNSPYKDLTKELATEKLTKDKDKIFNAIDNYVETKDRFDINFGDKLNDEQLEEITWLATLDNNWKSRAVDVFSDIQKVLNSSAAQLEYRYSDTVSDDKVAALRKLASTQPESFIDFINDNPAENKKLLEFLNDFRKDMESSYNIDKIDIILKTDDLSKIIKARRDAIKKLNEYMENPDKLQKYLDKLVEEAILNLQAEDSRVIQDKLGNAKNILDIRTALEESPNVDLAMSEVNKAADNGNSIAKNFRDILSYTDNINKLINDSEFSPEAKARAAQIYDDMYQGAETLQDVANPDNENIILAMLNGEIESVRTLLGAINKANNDLNFRDNFGGEYKKLKEIVEPAPGVYRYVPERDGSNDSGTPTGQSIAPINGKSIEAYEKPAGNITDKELKEENKLLLDTEESEPEPKDKGSRLYIRPSIPELHIGASKAGDFRPFNVVVLERELNVNFDAIYNYLLNHGAFEYINLGKLKTGDNIRFMIDPSMIEPTSGEPFIFLTTDDGQVVGSLDSGDASVGRYKGLMSLRKTILDLYKSADKSERFISDLTTKVSRIMTGKLQYGDDSKSLNTVLDNETPMLGFIKNGTLFTNEAISDADIVKPLDIMDKEGRLYLLSKRPDGKYGVSAVRVAHYNETELTDLIRNSKFFRNMLKVIEELANTTDNGKVADLRAELGKYLYIGNTRFDYFEGDTGNGLRITTPKVDENGNDIYNVDANGQRIREESSILVYFDLNAPVIGILGSNGITLAPPTSTNNTTAVDEINNALMSLNMPFQVYGKNMNKKLGAVNWNDLLSESGILSTNLVSTNYKGSWFITDYYDVDTNKFVLATPPATVGIVESSEINPVIGGQNTAVGGTLIDQYYVLSNGDILDGNGHVVTPKNAQEILDRAYLQSTYGDRMNGALMKDGLALLPSGKVYNRRTNSYASSKDSEGLRAFLSKRDVAQLKAEVTLGRLRDDLLRVDKERTDSLYYYIKEDDGLFHQYERVHSIIGGNWVESKAQTEMMEGILAKLYLVSTGDIKNYDGYILNLANKFKINLDAYKGKTDSKNRQMVINSIRDSLSGTLSVRALKAGSSIDDIMRGFFEGKTTVKPDNMTSQAYNDLLSSLSSIRLTMESNGNGERFYTNNIVLFHNYNGKRIAGEVDILSVDNDGVFRIYDVKSSKYSFYDFTKNGKVLNYFKNTSKNQRRSQEAQYTLQLSSYQNLFQSHYGSPIGGLAILPFVLEYDTKGNIKKITKEKGIPISYNTAIEVPLLGQVAKPVGNTNSLIPIFNNLLNITSPKEIIKDYNRLPDSKVGYYVKDGKIVKNYIKHIGNIGGVDIYISKVAKEITNLQGKPAGEGPAEFDVVFPNGNSKTMYKDVTTTAGREDSIIKTIYDLISLVPDRVKELASVETEISRVSPQGVLVSALEDKVIPSTVFAPKESGALAALAALSAALTPGLKKRPLDLRNRPKLSLPKPLTTSSSKSAKSILQNNLQGSKESIIFAQLDAETKQGLTKLGWTEELFNNVSREELEHALKCATL